MTGTPYNNSSQDLATFMAFVDPTLGYANDGWWKEVTTQDGAAASVGKAVAEWKGKFVIRRNKNALGDQLTRKTIKSAQVSASPLELDV